MKNIDVSIIVPCYNQDKYLSETLNSVLSQTYTNWECIIVDDGSPDNTKEIAEKYCQKDSRFKYVYKQNGGLASARNFGIKHSQGKYILPLDSDDKIERTYIEKTIKVLEQDNTIKVVYTRVKRFGIRNDEYRLPPLTIERLMGRNCIVCTALYRKEDYDKTKGYNENMKFGYEDWDFWLSLLEKGGSVYQIPEMLFLYRVKVSSMVVDMTEEQKDFLRKTVYNNHKELYSTHFFNPKESFEYISVVKSVEYYIGGLVPKKLIKLIRRILKR